MKFGCWARKKLFPLVRAEPAVYQPQGKPEPIMMMMQWSSWEHGAGPSDHTSTPEGRAQNCLPYATVELEEGLGLRSVDARGTN